MPTISQEPSGALRRAALLRLRVIMAGGLAAQLVATDLLADTLSLNSGLSGSAAGVALVSRWMLEYWFVAVPLAVVLYRKVERAWVERLSFRVLDEMVRLATVLWMSAVLALWYPAHRLCNCLEFLSETDGTVLCLPAVAVVLFVVALRSRPAPRTT